jgi:CRP/FNR family cyclic AMP-dependent transcriptional regulator
MQHRIALFEGLAPESLERLMGRSVERRYPKQTVVIHEGDDPTALYVIVEGRVRAYLTDPGGKEFVLATHGEGEYFGELALLDEAPRSASVATLEPCRLLVLSRASFEECLLQNPELGLQLLKGLVRRVRRLTESARTLALKDVFGRITALLQDLAVARDGVLVIEERLTHQEIARRIGASREMVSRILKDLETGGYIAADAAHRLALLRRLPASW